MTLGAAIAPVLAVFLAEPGFGRGRKVGCSFWRHAVKRVVGLREGRGAARHDLDSIKIFISESRVIIT
jgi:hypothetical protein